MSNVIWTGFTVLDLTLLSFKDIMWRCNIGKSRAEEHRTDELSYMNSIWNKTKIFRIILHAINKKNEKFSHLSTPQSLKHHKIKQNKTPNLFILLNNQDRFLPHSLNFFLLGHTQRYSVLLLPALTDHSWRCTGNIMGCLASNLAPPIEVTLKPFSWSNIV